MDLGIRPRPLLSLLPPLLLLVDVSYPSDRISLSPLALRFVQH